MVALGGGLGRTLVGRSRQRLPPTSPRKKIMEKENLKIVYGTENVSLNKSEQHIILTNEDMAFIVQSVLKNIPLVISISSPKL